MVRRGAAVSPAAIRREIAQDPASPAGWRRLAFERFKATPADALAPLSRALALASSAIDWSNLAEMRRAAGAPEAERAARRALALAPDLAQAHNNRGNLLMHADRAGSAAPVFARALALDPNFREAAYNRAAALAEAGDPARAVDLYDALLSRFPDFFEARWNRALALLASGRWREGWQAHEIRHAHPALAPRAVPVPAWDGGPLAGRRILLASEQGFGDTIQFLRYVPEVIRRGGRVVLDVPQPLLALARTIAGVEQLIASGAPVPEVDLALPLMSLPLRLGPEGPPPLPPYLAADPERRRRWRRRLSGDLRPRVGVAWAGNPSHRQDRRRSLDDRALGSLAGIESVRFVSLQKDRPPPAGWLDAAPDLADFADTAAAIAELDLVIAVDTATAHLAGALAKPLWVLLSPGGDWRWPEGPRTPWYPSARQLWRDREGGWGTALARLLARLAAEPLDSNADFP